MKHVTIGMVGGGYAAFLHGNGYRTVHGVGVRLKSVADVDIERAEKTARDYGFDQALDSFDKLLIDPQIDVIDICTPPFLHVSMAEQALAAGKHVICEKPLTGYFGREGDEPPIGVTVPKSVMQGHVRSELARLREVIARSGRRFMYAENFVYAPALQKIAEIVRARKNRILFIQAGESLKGSSSALAGEWKYTGGGVLIRAGIHPLTGALWLKKVEAAARGVPITVTAVHAETGRSSASLTDHEHRHITARPVDVEDFAAVTISFSDDSRALIVAADTVLGGTRNYLDAYCNDAALTANLTPTNLLDTYFLDEENMDDVYLAEMLPSKLGWNKAFVSDEIIRGYTGELQDFMECVADDREPESDFELAALTAEVLYAAYRSAEEGRRITL
jgi:predicted dehydrogenase